MVASQADSDKVESDHRQVEAGEAGEDLAGSCFPSLCRGLPSRTGHQLVLISMQRLQSFLFEVAQVLHPLQTLQEGG